MSLLNVLSLMGKGSLMFEVTAVRAEQPVKAASPMLVRLSGILIEVRLVHPEKAFSPMLVTLLVMLVFLHPLINVFV